MTHVLEVITTNIIFLVFEWKMALGMLLLHSWVIMFQMGVIAMISKVSNFDLA
jgi:hypothetical protein